MNIPVKQHLKSKVLLRRSLHLRNQDPLQVQSNSYKLVYELLFGVSIDMSVGVPRVEIVSICPLSAHFTCMEQGVEDKYV